MAGDNIRVVVSAGRGLSVSLNISKLIRARNDCTCG
jgi:hypothetical protein